MPTALVVIPTYNEKVNITPMIRAVLSLPEAFHVLIVDDNSPDGTAAEVEQQIPLWPGRLFLMNRTGKQGLGTAYIAGFKWALERNYDFITEMDADFSHPPADLSRLLKTCMESADVVIGSRYVKQGKVENWPLNRILLSKGASLYVRMITGMPVKDTTAGFVCYKRSVLERIDFDKIKFIGYAFQIELKFAAWKCGFTLKEIPITFKDREQGISKMSKGIFREALFGVVRIKWKSFSQSYTK